MPKQPVFSEPLHVAASLKERVWGGQSLGGAGYAGPPIGEAWLLHEDQAVTSGPHWGRTLAELTREYPHELLGAGWREARFPLLIKLLDCQDWLSVQLHPDDALARELVGPEELGKTEAWHVLSAAPGAKMITGTRAGVSLPAVQQGILAGRVAELSAEREVQAGETYMVPAGTLHALGPGLLIYEIQQTSDTTYRVYDWDRPASAGRELHLNQAVRAVKLGEAALTPAPPQQAGALDVLAQCEYFWLEQVQGGADTPLRFDTAGQGFHVLTVKAGELKLTTAAGEETMQPYDTVLLPAALGAYQLSGDFVALRGQKP